MFELAELLLVNEEQLSVLESARKRMRGQLGHILQRKIHDGHYPDGLCEDDVIELRAALAWVCFRLNIENAGRKFLERPAVVAVRVGAISANLFE